MHAGSQEEHLPDHKELEKQLTEFLSSKFGDKIKIVAAGALPLPKGEPETPAGDEEDAGVDFDMTPRELINYLDEYVVGQSRAKAVLATKICTHFNRVRRRKEVGGQPGDEGRTKNNILLIGPTGVGKTYLVKLIARRLGVPFVKGDATKFSETGYVGGDVEDLVRDLVREADDNIALAENGIIYIDEIDKIAAGRGRYGLDVSRSGVQRALLKPMEETEIDLKVPHDMISQIEALEHYRSTGKKKKRIVNTRNILFIMSGAFEGLDEIIGKRLNRRPMGFGGEIGVKAGDNPLAAVRAEDLTAYGFESEFIGRLPVLAVLDPLTVEDGVAILESPNSPVIQAKKEDFMAYGITVTFDHEALVRIAELAAARKTGARGLTSVIEEVLIPFETELPSTEIKFLAVDRALVDDPEAALGALLENPAERRVHEQRCHANREREIEVLAAFLREKKARDLERFDIGTDEERCRLVAAVALELLRGPEAACIEVSEVILTMKQWSAALGKEYDIRLEVDASAVDTILALRPFSPPRVSEFLRSFVHEVIHAWRLLKMKAPGSRVVIDAEALADPKVFAQRLLESAGEVGGGGG